jgi:hypothetical protein
MKPTQTFAVFIGGVLVVMAGVVVSQAGINSSLTGDMNNGMMGSSSIQNSLATSSTMQMMSSSMMPAPATMMPAGGMQSSEMDDPESVTLESDESTETVEGNGADTSTTAYGSFSSTGCKQVSKTVKIKQTVAVSTAEGEKEAITQGRKEPDDRLKISCGDDAVAPLCGGGCVGNGGSRVIDKTLSTAKVIPPTRPGQGKSVSYSVQTSGGGCKVVRDCKASNN